MTQGDLEEAAELGLKYVSKIERGLLRFPTDMVRKRIHMALGTSDEDLVEAGVVDRWEYEGSVVYIPKERETGRGVATVRPQTALPIEYVQEELMEAADGVRWTQGLLDVVLNQMGLFRRAQMGSVEAPRATWEDEE